MSEAAEGAPGAERNGLERALETQRAMLNVLEDLSAEKEGLDRAEAAVLNALEDSAGERRRIESTHVATLNILEDLEEEKRRIESTQTATLNILADLETEKRRLETMQAATLNVLADFDEEKRKVQRYNIELQAQIMERRRAQDELAERAEDLARSNAELEQFAFVASHDLQEPLRKVALYCQLLKAGLAGKLDAEAEQYLGFAIDGSQRMTALINDLLSFARLTAQRRAFAPVDCGALLDEAKEELRLAIQEAGAEIVSGPLPTLPGDGRQLLQVFRNLIGNSLKYRGAEPPRLRISAEAEGDRWHFAFQDNGIGIDPRYHKKVFALFQRLHTRKEYPGTGIGLAVCKKIVEAHGGRIWVESKAGEGATFHFTLPAGGSRG